MDYRGGGRFGAACNEDHVVHFGLGFPGFRIRVWAFHGIQVWADSMRSSYTYTYD